MTNQRSLEERVADLELQLVKIQERNHKVEQDKKWETSWARKLSIIVVTYFLASLVMWSIGVKDVFLNAIIPTGGYFLSTLSLSLIRNFWLKAN